MEPDSNLRLRRQTAGRHHPHRWSRQPEESGRNASQTLEDRKDENGETASQHRSRSQQYTEEGRFAEHPVRTSVRRQSELLPDRNRSPDTGHSRHSPTGAGNSQDRRHV